MDTRGEVKNIYEVINAINAAGLESSNLIIGIDFTKSNEWTGKHSFDGQSLHTISSRMLNPYQHAINIIGKALSVYDEDNRIPCFGFGDATTHDRKVFSFYPDGRPCSGIEGVFARYRELLPHITLSGPTSFAPLIYTAIDIVKQSGNQFHVLVIIADGQVTGNIGMGRGILSQQERETVDAIVAASYYPLSIVMVGVGDGPWDTMENFDDALPSRKFDNFQFVNHTEIMAKYQDPAQREAVFAAEALMEIPEQYTAIKALGGLRGPTYSKPNTAFVIPPPLPQISSKPNAMGGYNANAGYNYNPSYISSSVYGR